MSLLWFVTLVSLGAALLAWRQARAAARRAQQLSQMYWELKYQHGELRVQLQRLASAGSAGGAPQAADAPAPPSPGQDAGGGFIPLSSLKR